MKAYKHILIATDFTKFSEKAVKRAVDLARHSNAKLTLLHVVEHFPGYLPVSLVPPEDVDPTHYVIYIGASDLVPEVKEHESLRVNLENFLAFISGLALMLVIKVTLGG